MVRLFLGWVHLVVTHSLLIGTIARIPSTKAKDTDYVYYSKKKIYLIAQET
jgi:hypothetical protein